MNLNTSHPLLLIIDMQNVYDQGHAWECPNFGRALDNIECLIKAHITDNICATRFIAPMTPTGVWEKYNEKYAAINQSAAENELPSRLSKLLSQKSEGTMIIDKNTYSSYKVPEIKKIAAQAPYVIVTGVTTGCCVLSTVMDLIDAGIYVVILKDATAGSSIECEEAVWETLFGLSPLHLTMIDTQEYLHSGC